MFTAENKKVYFGFLAVSTVLYFAAIRWLQDYLYSGVGRPVGLFASLGELFAIPEPLEIPLYFLGLLAIPAASLALYYLHQEDWLKYLLVVVGLGIILSFWKLAPSLNIPNIQSYADYLQTHGIGQVLWLVLTKRIFLTKLVLGAGLLVFLAAYFRNWNFTWLFDLEKKGHWQKLELLFVIFLAAVVFHPNLPVDPHHYNYFMGPVNDIFQGKPLLYETSHLYGLLDIYFLLVVFKFLLPFTYQALSAITAGFFWAYFVAIFYFLKNWLRSLPLAAFGSIAITSIFFLFNTSPTRTVYFFPAMGPFRFWLYVPVMWLLLAYQKSRRPVLAGFAIFLSVVAVFWNLESGLAVALATFIALLLADTFSWHRLLSLAGKFVFYGLLIFGAISILNYAVYGSWPAWQLFFKEIVPFGAGIGMSPLPAFGVFDLFVFLYLSVGIYLTANYFRGQAVDVIAGFLVVYGIFSSIYYVGQSSWQNLYLVAGPPILLALYLFKNFPKERAVRAGFYSLLGLTVLFLLTKLPVEFQNRDYRNIKSLTAIETADQDLYADAVYLRNNFPQSRLPVMSMQDDTKLLIYASKANWFDFYYTFSIYYHDEMDQHINRVLREKPEMLFIGKKLNDRLEYFINGIKDFYAPEEDSQLRTLQVYKPI